MPDDAPAPDAAPGAEEMMAQIAALDVRQLLLSTVMTLASLAYGKLAPETRDLADAQLAIDALRALLPLLPEAERGSIQPVVSSQSRLASNLSNSGS